MSHKMLIQAKQVRAWRWTAGEHISHGSGQCEKQRNWWDKVATGKADDDHDRSGHRVKMKQKAPKNSDMKESKHKATKARDI